MIPTTDPPPTVIENGPGRRTQVRHSSTSGSILVELRGVPIVGVVRRAFTPAEAFALADAIRDHALAASLIEERQHG